MELDENDEEPDFTRVNVNADMSRDDVVDLILDTTNKEANNAGNIPPPLNQTRLLDGYYKPIDSLMHFWKIDGEKIEAEDFHNMYNFKPTIKYGDFGKNSSFDYNTFKTLAL